MRRQPFAAEIKNKQIAVFNNTTDKLQNKQIVMKKKLVPSVPLMKEESKLEISNDYSGGHPIQSELIAEYLQLEA